MKDEQQPDLAVMIEQLRRFATRNGCRGESHYDGPCHEEDPEDVYLWCQQCLGEKAADALHQQAEEIARLARERDEAAHEAETTVSALLESRSDHAAAYERAEAAEQREQALRDGLRKKLEAAWDACWNYVADEAYSEDLERRASEIDALLTAPAANRLEPITDTQTDRSEPIVGGPIALNEAQVSAVREWAADDRLWTTQETVEINLRTFARLILKHSEAAPAGPVEGTASSPEPRVGLSTCGRCGRDQRLKPKVSFTWVCDCGHWNKYKPSAPAGPQEPEEEARVNGVLASIDAAPTWWKQCRDAGHEVAIFEKPRDVEEFFCSACARGASISISCSSCGHGPTWHLAGRFCQVFRCGCASFVRTIAAAPGQEPKE